MLGRTRNGRVSSRVGGLHAPLAGLALLTLAACERPLSPQLALILSEHNVEFQAIRGSSTPLTRTITVSNAGGGRLGPVTCSDVSAPWLACSVASGNIVTLTANPTGLTSSPPQATVTLNAPGAAGGVTIQASMLVQEPALALNASTVVFSSAEGTTTTTPASTTVAVSNTGAGTYANLGTIACTPTPANPRVTCTVNQATGTLSVSVNPAGLAPGTYIYPVSVTAQHATTPRTFTVALEVGALPRIGLSRQSLHFQMSRGATEPQSQTVTVTNIGTGSLGTIGCTSPATWLTCTVSGNSLVLTASAAGLETSPAAANVSVTAANAINSPQTITVTLGLDQPVLSLSTDAVTFTSQIGSNVVTPASTVVTVSNSGAGTVESLGAITCTPPENSPVVCTVAATGHITLSIDATKVVGGLNIYPVQVRAENSIVTRTIAVTVNVTSGQRLGVSPSAVHFSAIRGSTSAQAQVIQLTNLAGGTLQNISCPSAPASWITCTLGTNSVVISVIPTGLTASPSAVSVPITATIMPQNESVSEPVIVTMAIEQPVLAVTPTSAVINGAGSTNVQVSNTGAGALANLGTIACSQPANLTCTVNQGTGVLTIASNVAGLAAGTHVRVVNVTATNAANTQTVTISIVVP